jgi:urea carboxylase-associated protein 1
MAGDMTNPQGQPAGTASPALVSDEILPAGAPWGRILRRGQTLTIIDLEGRQAVDFLCYDADDPSDRYNAANTLKVQGNIYITSGAVLYSERMRPLLTVVEDTCGGHDSIAGCCSAPSNELRYGVRDTPSCYSNFERILAEFGLDRGAIVSNINFFMSVPIEPDGTMAIVDGHSVPGSRVTLRAERDVLVAISNCPQIYNPASGFKPTPIRLIVSEPAAR